MEGEGADGLCPSPDLKGVGEAPARRGSGSRDGLGDGFQIFLSKFTSGIIFAALARHKSKGCSPDTPTHGGSDNMDSKSIHSQYRQWSCGRVFRRVCNSSRWDGWELGFKRLRHNLDGSGRSQFWWSRHVELRHVYVSFYHILSTVEFGVRVYSAVSLLKWREYVDDCSS